MTEQEYRQRHADGFVIFDPDGEACGWSLELADASIHRPGCVAVSAGGFRWIARGGDDERGADRWEPMLAVIQGDLP